MPRPGVIRIARADDGRIAHHRPLGRHADLRRGRSSTCQTWLLSTRIHCEERLFPAKMWTAIEKTHYMQASKTFVMVDRPFWKTGDPKTGRYLDEHDALGPDDARHLSARSGRRPAGVICLSYTWNDDALKWLPLPVDERVRLMLHS